MCHYKNVIVDAAGQYGAGPALATNTLTLTSALCHVLVSHTAKLLTRKHEAGIW